MRDRYGIYSTAFLLGMIVAISILRSSGAIDAFVQLLSPLLVWLGIPPEIVPLALVRPISGTAALGVMTELTQTYGPDSLIGRLAATMQGSTDTTLYILTVYFGAVGIKRMRYALKVGLLADLMGLIAAIAIVHIVFKVLRATVFNTLFVCFNCAMMNHEMTV